MKGSDENRVRLPPTMKCVMVLLPTLDEAEGIAEVLPRIPHSALERSGWEVQVLVVDGGSDDGTIQIAEALGCSTLQQHGKGKGAAMRQEIGRASCRERV